MDFQKEVIEQSKERPVVVDFWAPWCGPCKTLGPIIEELAELGKDQWTLVKVNSDDHQDIATAYRIKGIPAVKLFHQGEVIAEFTGALPRHQIEQWLETHLPDERKDKLSELETRMLSGEKVTDQLQAFVTDNPDLDEGRLLLAKALVFDQPSQALILSKEIKNRHKFLSDLEDLQSLVDFMTCELEADRLSQKIIAARSAAQAGDMDMTIEGLIEVVMINKNFCNEMPRRASIALFHLLGDAHELTAKYRRRFDMALY